MNFTIRVLSLHHPAGYGKYKIHSDKITLNLLLQEKRALLHMEKDSFSYDFTYSFSLDGL